MRHAIVCLFLAICLLAASGHAQADDASLYQGSTLVNSQGNGERVGALQRALAQVIVKLSGQRSAAQMPEVRGILAAASRLVQDSRYSAESETVNGAPMYRQKFTATFDRSGVDGVRSDLGGERLRHPDDLVLPAVIQRDRQGQPGIVLGSALGILQHRHKIGL
jgi:hypothetical protein